MWGLIEFFLSYALIKLSKDVDRTLLERPGYKLKIPSTISNEDLSGIHTKTKILIQNYRKTWTTFEFFDEATLIDLKKHLQLLSKFFTKTNQYIKDPLKELPEHENGDPTCICAKCVEYGATHELIPLYIRMTILNDHYFENDKTTAARSGVYTQSNLIWLIQLRFRLLYRRKDILIENKSEPVWNYPEAFKGNGFPVINSKEEAVPIAKLDPEEIHKALVALLESRSFYNTCEINSSNRRRVFTEYRQALLDRLSTLCVLEFPKVENAHHPSWYSSGAQAEEEMVSSLSISDESKAISLQVREHALNEKKRLLKELEEDNLANSEDKKKRLLSLKARHYLTIKEQENCFEDQIYEQKARLIRKLASFEEQDDDLEVRELEEEDKLEMEYIKLELKAIENVEKEFTEKKKIETEEGNKKRKQYIKAIMGSKSSETQIITMNWVSENMLLADHISIWQFLPNHLQIMKLDTKIRLIGLVFYRELTKALYTGSEQDILNESQDWIIEHCFVTFAERESYRLKYTAKATFNSREVSGYNRRGLVTLSNFPTSIDELLKPVCPYHELFLCYATEWFLNQYLQKININETVFMWDIEEEYASLNRNDLNYPVISKIGMKFLVMYPGNWETKRGWLNCGWSYSFLAVVAQWFLLTCTKYNFQIENRMTGVTHKLTQTFYELYYEYEDKLKEYLPVETESSS